MPQSYILSKLKNVLSHSYFLNFLVRQVDVNEELKYESVITASFYKPIVFLNSLLEWIANHTYIKALSERIDLKSVVIFVFIVSQVLFPGYGTENTGTALLPGSPVNSVGFKTGFYVSSLFFIIFFVGLIAVFIRDIIKKGDNLLFSKFEVILLFFIISIEISSSLSIYPTISFLWIIKFLRGIFVYYLVSRIIITRMNINTISYSYMTIIFIEFILSVTMSFLFLGSI